MDLVQFLAFGCVIWCAVNYIASKIQEAKDEITQEIDAYRAQIGILEDELAQARAFYEEKSTDVH